ncbi:MAG: hypothetical protein F6K42_27275 [Leptolyngbya sp. SIO1D8]|nr:hypothetical protein [Leptolyngbya sp. SIO1D8]
MWSKQQYDNALAALESKATAQEDLATNLGNRVISLSYVSAELARQLRPDLTLMYADHDEAMVAALLVEFGEDGLIEALIGYSPATLIT